jgi:glycosyltransferase involved in cell wall biosynthesis
MRICFLEYASFEQDVSSMPCYPIATLLAQRGHDVHVITGGIDGRSRRNGVWIHEISVSLSSSLFLGHSEVNEALHVATRLYEALLFLSTEMPFDVVEAPLEGAQSFVAAHRYQAPIVLRVDSPSPSRRTTSGAVEALEHACLRQAAGLIASSEASVRETLKRYRLSAHHVPYLISTTDDDVAIDRRLAWYESLIRRAATPVTHVYQVMEALDEGDAVSTIARNIAHMLSDFGQPSRILARFWNKRLHNEVYPLHYALSYSGHLIFHYWGYNTSTWLLVASKGRKAIYYHNITPPEFFAHDRTLYERMKRGYKQLCSIMHHFDLIIGDSWYNVHELRRYKQKLPPAIAIYPVIETESLHRKPFDQALLKRLKNPRETNIVFIGRIARNKRQDRLIELFHYYCREINPHARLWLVGSNTGDPEYYSDIERLRARLSSGDRIHCTGKVSESELYAYYRAADVFVCASEHEGFCVPIAEAMAFDIPVIAFAAAAIPETMGGAGFLINRWDVPRIAELIHLLVSDGQLRERVVSRQRHALRRFSQEEARLRVKAVIDYLVDGVSSPMFVSV